MMNHRLNDVLFNVAEETLEKLAFMFVSREYDREDIDYNSIVAASISFSGPFSGKLVLTISTNSIPELSANMLGVEEDETTPDQQDDALKETLNVICGNILPAIAGKKAVFNITAPFIVSGMENIKKAVEKADGKGPSSVVRMEMDGEQCDIFLFIDGEIPEDFFND
ncbi:MAG TPA: chemotaxis protein CheX [Desulfobacteraceae bacterium]|nr:chemotaxis protein CheX [Desulfobacteraceae bacterium]